jgi:hypothetical protein
MISRHSQFILLGILAWWSETPWLVGFLLGGVMHLALDIAFNGQLTPRSIWAFYSFTYRARHRFAARALFGDGMVQPANSRFWKDFFRGARIQGAADSPPTRRAPVGDAEALVARLPTRRGRPEFARNRGALGQAEAHHAQGRQPEAHPVAPNLVQHGRHGRIVADRRGHVPPAQIPGTKMVAP